MDSQLLPNLFHYIQSTWPAVDRGPRQHNVFTVTPQNWRYLVQLGWSRHKAAAFTRLQCKDTAFIKKSFAGLFIHGRNHAITHGHAFCQRFAWQTYKSKFGDTAVHQQVPLQPLQAEEFLRSTVSCLFLRRYKWEINLRTSSSPTAYLLFKQKKDFKGAGARPIISYIYFMCAKLFRVTAIVLDVILRTTCPRSFGFNTYSILQQLTEFFLQQPFEDAPAVVYNQDLVGLFTSIPVFRILSAIRWAISESCLC